MSDFDPGRTDAPKDETADVFDPSQTGLDPVVADRSALTTTARLGAQRDPAQHANVLRMADYTGIPVGTVERNPQEVKQVFAEKSVDVDSVIDHSPVLTAWLKNFDNMAVAHDDIKSLQGLEWWTGRMHPSGESAFSGRPRMVFDEGAMSRALKVGARQRERSEIGWNLLLSGRLPESDPRVAELDAFLAEDYGKESHGTFGRMATGSLELLAPMATGAAAAVATGAGFGAMAAGAGPGAPVTVPAATSAGAFIGLGYDTLKQEAGSAYFDVLDAMRERGGTVSPRAAAATATLVGTVNAAIEVVGSKVALQFFPFLGPILGQAAKPTFGGMTLKKAIAKAAVGYVATLTEETATEVAQQAMTSLGREAAVGATGGPTDFAQIPGELKREGIEAGLSMVLTVLPGASGQFTADLSEMRQGLQAQQRLETLGNIQAQSKLAKNSPEAMADFAARAAEGNAHPESVLVSADAWTTLFQGKGMDPAAAAAQIGVGEEYVKAAETGGFVAIPFETYASQIAPNTEYNSALAPDSKFYQESMTGREAEEHLKVISDLAPEMDAETDEATKKSPIYVDRFSQLVAAGVSETDADHYARLHDAFFKTMAQRTGLSTEDLQTSFPLSIQSGEVVEGPEITLNQKVWQGSPAKELKGGRWSDEFIGSGEDTMGQGAGHYFSSKQSVAEWYRKSLSDSRSGVVMEGAPEGWTNETLPKPYFIARAELADSAKVLGVDSGDQVISRTLQQLNTGLALLRADKLVIGSGKGSLEKKTASIDAINRIVADQEQAVELIKSGKVRYGPPGNVFEADIPDVEHLLNWDSELRDQPEAVLAALKSSPAWKSVLDRMIQGDQSAARDKADYQLSRLMKFSGKEFYNSLVAIIEDRDGMSDEIATDKQYKAWGVSRKAARIQASAILRDAGIPGHTYESDSGNKNFVIFDAAKIEPLASLYQGKRGSITFSKPMQPGKQGGFGQFLTRFGILPRKEGFTITLSQDADVSTFLHETGHYFLEAFGDLAYRDQATDQTRTDYEALLGWFGVKTRDEIGVAHHEKFAVAFEKYLEEGKAPSLGLVRTFARFSAWLKSLYRKVGRLGVDLSDDVRKVMDRMIATDDAISAVEQSSAYIPMFRSAEEAGMSEAAFAEYQNKAAQAHLEAQKVLGARIAADQRRETEAWWKEEKAKVREDVAAKINAERPVQAYRYFTEGLIPEGADPQVFADENGEPFKLSLPIVNEEYPGIAQSVRRELGRTGLAVKGGVHPDAVSPLFGYESGDQLLQTLTTQENPDRRIARETNQIMVERHGDVLNDGTLPRVAEDATRDSRSRLSQLLEELDSLNRRAGNRRVKLTEADLKASAFASIRAGRVRDLDPAAFQRAERTAATQAIRAAGKGKYDEAVDWQRRRLLNFALAREAASVQKEAIAAAKFLQKSGKDSMRARLGKARSTYQEQQDALLQDYDFATRSLTQIDRSSSLKDWVEGQRAQGFDPIISDRLLSRAFRTNWKDMPVQDLLDLRDAVKSIQHQASRKNQLIIAGNVRAFAATKTEALDSLKENVPDPGGAKISETNAGALARFAEFRNKFDAFTVRLEELALEMDGEDPNGIFSQILVHAFADAQAAEKDLGLKTAKKLLKAYEELPAEDRKLLKTGKVYIDSIKQEFTYQDLLGIAANYGNDSNYTKLLRGYESKQPGLIPWTPEVIEEALSHLTKAHWDYLQKSWDILEDLWPAAEALEKRRTGLAPPKVERRSFTRTFPDGTTKTYAGGYYPVIPHPDFSHVMAEKMTGPEGGPFDPKTYVAAITPHGHLIERTGAAFPLSLNIHRLPGHIAQVVHDTTHREAVIEAWRFLTDTEVAAEIKYRMGVPVYQTMLERLRRVASARGMTSFEEGLMGKGMAALAASVMGYKATVATQNFANIAIAKVAVGAFAYTKAFNEFVHDRKSVVEFVHNSSGEMRHRFTTRDNETRREFERAVSGDSWTDQVRRGGYLAAALTNSLVDYPTWLASYRNSTKAGKSHEESVRIADSVIRTNFGAGGVKDLAIFQDARVFRYFAMFSGWFNTAYNAQRKIIRETKGLAAEKQHVAAAQHLFVNEFWRVAVMAVASELLSGRGPDDGEDAWEWMVERIALYHASMYPVIREMAAALDQKSDPRLFGLESLSGQVVRAIQKDVKAAKHGNLAPFAKDAIAIAATLKGLPVSQARITGGYIYDLATGKARPDDPGEFFHDLIFRRDKKRRR